MKTARLQAAFARKREVDNLRIERTQETNRYFDHWGKVTSRFQTWTTPEYYENAEIKLKEHKEKLKKDEILNERRDKLQKLLDIENQQYENELQSIILRKHSPSVDNGQGRRRRHSKYDSIDTNILEKIKENHTDEMKRLELEAKLYKKWRNPNSGVTLSTTPLAIVGNNGNGNGNANDNEHLRNNSLFESKSDNEIMAKLNWLDKQIENQMRREEDEKEFQQRTLKLQEEATKREEIQRQRQLIRESEIKELRTMQENNVAALKQREIETIQLQEDEQHYRHILDTIETELNSLKLNYENFLKIFETNLPHNVKRIKILFRQLSDEFNERFQKDIDLLKRMKLLYSYAYNTDNKIEINDSYTSVSPSDQIRLQTIEQLIEHFEQQYNTENLNPSDICNMYESEAKNNFKKWQDCWYNQENLRKIKLIELLERDQMYYDGKLNDNIKQQKLIIEIRETHLSAMENSNEKLKMLINSNNYSNNDNSNNSNNNHNHNNNNNNTKESKYDNYNRNNNNINAYDNSEYIQNKKNNNSTTLKDLICWNANEPTSSPSPALRKHQQQPPQPATTTVESRLSRRSDGGACAAAIANRNASRSSSRISHIYDLNSYREESANSFQNTKSRIFGWLDDDNPDNKIQQENLSQSNNNNDNIHSFHKKRIIPNRRTTEGIINTTNANNNAIIPINNTIREDLISDLRERNSRSRIINEQNNNKYIIDDKKSTKPSELNPTSKKVAISIDVPQSNNIIYSDIEQIDKRMNNNLNITNNNNQNQDKSSNDTQMNNTSSGLGPKFGRKKFAWT